MSEHLKLADEAAAALANRDPEDGMEPGLVRRLELAVRALLLKSDKLVVAEKELARVSEELHDRTGERNHLRAEAERQHEATTQALALADNWLTQFREAKVEVERLRKVVEFYATADYRFTYGSGIALDRGQVAKIAIKPKEPK